MPNRNNIPEFFDLLHRARNGDDESLGELLEKYRNYLSVIAHADTDSWLKEKIGPSDLVQVSLISGFENFSQFRGESESELSAWLKSILKNGIRNGQRHFFTSKRGIYREVPPQESGVSKTRPIVDPELTPQSRALADEKARSIEHGLDKLSIEQRRVIELRNFQQMEFAEIGRQTGRSEDAARKFWARAIEALKTAIKIETPGLIDESRSIPEHHD